MALLVLAGLGMLAGPASAQPVVNLFGVHQYPPEDPIDATTVNNFGTLSALNEFFPWDTQNTTNFVNQASGVMSGAPGFLLDHVNGNSYERSPLLSFTNLGSIFATTRLVISATNLVNAPGALLSADRGGTVHLEALNGTMDLFGSRIRAGEAGSGRPNFFEGGNFINDILYENPANVMDEYWGVGTNGTLELDILNFGGISDPEGHRVRIRALAPEGGLGTRVLDQFLFMPEVDTNFPTFPGYSFYVTTNYVYNGGPATGRNWRGVVQMVMVQTNLLESPDVRVYFFNAVNRNNYILQQVAVELGIHDQDPLTGQDYTRYLRLIDKSATNASAAGTGSPRLFSNYGRVGTFRPDTFEVERSDFPLFGITGFDTPAIPYDPAYIYYNDQRLATNIGARFETNRTASVFSGYQFSIRPRDLGGAGTGADYLTGFFPLDEHNDPTNSAGRVEIEARDLNLRLANIRAENLISIKATNVLDMSGARFNAQNINLNLTGNTGSIVLSNATPTRVSRLNGAVTVWSAVWQIDQFVTNSAIGGIPIIPGVLPIDGTNTINYTYQLTVVDLNNFVVDAEDGALTFRSSPISTNQTVVFPNFSVNQPAVELHDTNLITRTFYLGGTNWLVGSNALIQLSGANTDFTAGNAPNLLNFTNLGTLFVPLSGNFGFDRTDAGGGLAPYANIVNRGSITSGSLLFRAANFQNASSLSAFNGALFIDARTNRLDGGQVFASGNVHLSGDEVFIVGTNSPFGTIAAGATLVIDLTNRLTDLNLTNQWTVSGGFALNTKPVKGDLLATRLLSSAGTNQNVIHYWGAEDRGDSPSGYANNSAVGELVLDGAPGSRFLFLPLAGRTNALYVDTLTLTNNSTNYSTALSVDANMTIYFANANVPGDKLTNAFPGRFVWVSAGTRTGPLVAVRTSLASSTLMSTQQYEALLASSPDVDGDGIPNELDETPFSGFTISNVQIVDAPPYKMALISWQALAGSAYTLEYRNGLNTPAWSVLGTYTAAATGMKTVGDVVPPGGQRFYRVRYGN